jgi:hypothetical protein
MSKFEQFLTGLRADARLGRYLPAPTQYQTPETVILALTIALANAVEGEALHPAHRTLEELDNPAPRPLRPPMAQRGPVGLVMGAE